MTPSSYSIRLFGTPSVSNEAGDGVTGLSLGKPLALLSYLVVQGKTPREEVIALLWGDVAEAKARNAFRQALHRLRSALGEDAIPHDPDHLSVDEELRDKSDVRTFEKLLEAGKLEEALEVYGGDFLSGLDVGESAFDQWRDAARKRYKAKLRDALRTVVESDIASGEISRALRRASALAASDSGDVEGAILHASTLLGAGRRAEAQQVLEDFERRYREDFDAAAPAAIREFLSRLRRARPEYRGTAGAREQLAFVGREKELSILLARMRALESGRGSLVVIDGDEGVGKTRLVEEFFLRARDLGAALFLQGRERSAEAGIAYASVGEALRGALDAPGVAGTGQHLLAEAARLLPQLRDQFSLPQTPDIVDDTGRLRFYEGIAALLDSVAYEQPVCIALDDFHNSSGTTYGLVEYLAERLSAAPILFLVAGRITPVFTARRQKLFLALSRGAAGRNESAPAHIALGGLDAESARDLAAQLAGSSSDADIDEIVRATAGIPFRIIEVCDRIRSGEEVATTPVRMRDVLWGRLQRSTQAEQRLFVTVALFDRQVSIRLLAAASHVPEKAALDAALALEREGLLCQRLHGVGPAHDFSGELALSGAGPAGRALLAGWAADALVHEGSGTAAELARLFSIAGRRKEAFTHSRNAAFEAMASGANDEAAQHAGTALANAPTRQDREEAEKLLRSLGAGPLRLGGGSEFAADAKAEPAGESSAAESVAVPENTPAIANERPSPKRPQRLRLPLTAAGTLAVIAFVFFRLIPGFNATRIPGTSLADTLIVAHEIDPHDTVIAFTTGRLGTAPKVLEGATRHGLTRTWIDSLRLPWTNPLPSPDGRNVAIERITKNGSELYVISMDRRDTIPLRSGEGDDFSNGWSPDGRWLLATHGETRSDGTYKAELFGYSIFRGGPRIVFDSVQSTAVVEAVWSPDGSHVGWTARVGPQHQEEIFVSDADGQNVVNISNSAAEDYSIAWSPDGTTIAFTSERSGRAELYSEEITTGILRRLTWEGAHADHAAYSPDGRWLAYESTRGGNPAVYVMPSGGGTGRSVASALERVSLVGWRGRPVPYIDQIFIDVPPLAAPGDTGGLVVRALDRRGNQMRVAGVRVRALDPALIRIASDSEQAPNKLEVIALGRGLARVTATAGSWRADTAFIPIGQDALALVEDHFERPLNPNVWRLLGDPAPIVARQVGSGGSGGLLARSDRQWQSGVLSRTIFPLRRGLSADVWMSAPFSERPAARTCVVALVAADPADVVDSSAPEFLRLAAVSWVGEAGRISYSVGAEVFTEPLSNLEPGDTHQIRISVAADDAVEFYVDDKLRWKSSLHVLTEGPNSRAQLWLGSQASGNAVVFDDVVVRLQPTASPKH